MSGLIDASYGWSLTRGNHSDDPTRSRNCQPYSPGRAVVATPFALGVASGS